jgi:hypothetical protein
MSEKYNKNEVELSFRKFNDYADDVLESDYSTFESNLEIFIDHCENDKIMSIICNQLKYNSTIFDNWWSENSMSEPGCFGGKQFKRPVNEKERDALLFQICLKINKKELTTFSFCLNFGGYDLNESVYYFNKNVVKPMVRSMEYKLTEITSKATTEQGNKEYILKEALFVYNDYSTNINGNVDIKGDGAVGEGAKIKKKSIV